MYLDILVEEFPDLLPKLTQLRITHEHIDIVYKQEYFDQINLKKFHVNSLDICINIKHMSKMEKLYIDNSNITGINKLINIHQLIYINMDLDLDVSKLTNIECLILRNSENVTGINHLQKLKFLDICGNSILYIYQINKNCKIDCLSISNINIHEHMCDSLNNLKSLKLTKCNIDLQYFNKNLKYLSIFYSRCTNLGKMDKLTHLSLKYCYFDNILCQSTLEVLKVFSNTYLYIDKTYISLKQIIGVKYLYISDDVKPHINIKKPKSFILTPLRLM